MKFELPDSIAGVTFRDRALLQRALTHRSYLNEHIEEALEDNERLEYLGDAVLSLVTAQYLYNRFPEYKEGGLTKLRAALVREETLAEFANQIGLGQHLLLGRGEEDTGGRSRSSVLADAFEAFIGAVYLDRGHDFVWHFLEPFVRSALLEAIVDRATTDSRSELQELTQARFAQPPRYRTVAERGPSHAKEFAVEVFVGEVRLGRGTGTTKQSAAKGAAEEALSRVRHVDQLEDVEPLPALPETDDEALPEPPAG